MYYFYRKRRLVSVSRSEVNKDIKLQLNPGYDVSGIKCNSAMQHLQKIETLIFKYNLQTNYR